MEVREDAFTSYRSNWIHRETSYGSVEMCIRDSNRNKALTRKQLLTVLWLLFRGPVNSNL